MKNKPKKLGRPPGPITAVKLEKEIAKSANPRLGTAAKPTTSRPAR